jgi:NADPH:quinone reductase
MVDALMRAFVVRAISEDLSGADIADIPMPTPGPGEVAIAVQAAGVNFPDYLMCQGKYQFKPDPPFVPGLEAAGVVMALGPGGGDFRLGERVVAGLRLGGFAECACAPVEAVRVVPAGMGLAAAAGFQAAYLTAYVGLVRRGRLRPGQTVLIHGAAGGVGLAAVDLAKHLGARVIATASTPSKRAFLSGYGADLVLAPAGFKDAVKDATQGRGADLVYDPVGGDVFDESLRCTAFDGAILVIGFASGRIPSLSVNLALIKGISIIGVRAGEYGRQFPERGRENLEAIWALAGQGAVHPHVHAEVPLADAKSALSMLPERQVIGKLVLTP